MFRKDGITSNTDNSEFKHNLTPEDFFKDLAKERCALDGSQMDKRKIRFSNIFKRKKSSKNNVPKKMTREEEYQSFVEDSKFIQERMLSKKGPKQIITKKLKHLYNSLKHHESDNDTKEYDDDILEKVLSPPNSPIRKRRNEFVDFNKLLCDDDDDEMFSQSLRSTKTPYMRRKSSYRKKKRSQFGRSMPTRDLRLTTIHEDLEQSTIFNDLMDEDYEFDNISDYIDLGGPEIHYFDML
uniref:Protein SPT2 homolog n=1 Tax=Parastrongyloides trichosuri TaxID=131310 RepID=A0A0N4ZW17_PARTI